mgnify:CR=1 FL=1|jgi:hypothetical protein
MEIQLIATTTVSSTKKKQETRADIIGKDIFISEYIKHFSLDPDNQESKKAANDFWNIIFGNRTDYDLHPHYRYLTRSSCNIILKHSHKFISGFDFSHLPTGFCLKEHESTTSALHYNEHVQEESSALAIKIKVGAAHQNVSFTDKGKDSWLNFFQTRISNGQSTPLCNKSDIKNALIEFFDIIVQKNSELEALDLPKIEIGEIDTRLLASHNFNPIIVIARMASIIKNPYLQPKNYKEQFQVLASLPLWDSRTVTRTMADLHFSDKPLSIMLPEHSYENLYMHTIPPKHISLASIEVLGDTQIEELHGTQNDIPIYSAIEYSYSSESEKSVIYFSRVADFNHIGKSCKESYESLADDNFDLISKEIQADFLKYIAVNDPAASIDTYKRCFEKIMEVGRLIIPGESFNSYRRNFKPTGDKVAIDHYISMYKMLARSTSGINFRQHREANYEELWSGLCKVLINIPVSFSNVTTALSLQYAANTEARMDFINAWNINLISQFLYGASRLEQLPEIEFLYSMLSNAVADNKKAASVTGIAAAVLMRTDPTQELEELSDNLNIIIKKFGSSVYSGNKFWFDSDTNSWKAGFTQKEYVTYLSRFERARSRSHSEYNNNNKFLVAILSNFHHRIPGENFILDYQTDKKLYQLNRYHHFLLFHLQRMTRQAGSILNLINLINSLHEGAINKEIILEKMKSEIGAACFPAQYFENAIEVLNTVQLTNPQEQELTKYLGHDSKLIKPILVNIKSHESKTSTTILTTPTYFNKISNQFLELHSILEISAVNFLCIELQQLEQLTLKQLEFILQQIIISKSTGILTQFIFCKNNILKRNAAPRYINENIGEKLSLFYRFSQTNQETEQDPSIELIKNFPNKNHAKEIIASLCLFGIEEQDIKDLFNAANTLVETYPTCHALILNSIDNALLKDIDAIYLKNILMAVADNLELQEQAEKTFYSLLHAFEKRPGKWALTAKLIETCPKILKYIGQLLDNKSINLSTDNDDLSDLHTYLTKNDSKIDKLNIFLEVANTPPYPKIPELIDWLGEDSDISEKYASFCQAPYTRVTANQYNRDEYKRLLKGFDSASKDVFTSKKDNFDSFIKSMEDNRNLSFQDLQSADKYTDEQKLAYVVEMLARNAYQHSGQDQIAQELNTAQIMTLFVMMHNVGSKYMAQIDTGEGKSRIFITHAIWLVLKGKTVDLVTSNTHLSERDYLGYSSLAGSTGVKTSLITTFSEPGSYSKGGINFSDNSSLALLRIKHNFLGTANAFADERNKRVLLVDEADTLIHDKVPDSYKYAEIKDDTQNFNWVYAHLIKFKQQNSSDNFMQYINDNEACPEKKDKLAQLYDFKPKQIETWLEGAQTALDMQKGHHYTISDEFELVHTLQGSEYSKVIKVIENGRIRDGFVYQNGIHALLAAKENLANLELNIHIQPESDTLTSQNTAQFLADYDAITGVTGSTAHEIFNNKDIQTDQSYKYITVPNQKPNQRKIQHPIIMKNHTEQLAEIKRFINAANDKPILIFCEDDNEIEELNAYLKGISGRGITKITAKSSASSENKAITSAGQNNNITIATAGRMGRGTDIKNPAGNLQVLITYTPSHRDQKQISSRTARYGMPGSCHYIIDKIRAGITTSSNQFSKLINEQTYESDKNFYLKNEAINIYSWLKLAIKEQVDADPVKLTKILEQQAEKHIAAIQGFQDSSFAELDTYLRENITTEIINLYGHEIGIEPTFKAVNHERMADFAAKIEGSHANLVKLYKSFPKLKQQEFIEADEYHRSHDGQAVSYSTWFAKTRATFSGKRALFADTRAWWNDTGYLFQNYGVKSPTSTNNVLYANIIIAIALSLIAVQQYATLELLTIKLISWVSAAAIPSIAAFIVTPIGLAAALSLLLFAATIATSYHTTMKTDVSGTLEASEHATSSEFNKDRVNKEAGFGAKSADTPPNSICSIM